MKYYCLGYSNEQAWEALSQAERKTASEACQTYCELLREGGNLLGTEALQPSRTAATLRFENGKVAVTDGPFAETKEHLGGLFVLEAKDLNHAIQLMSGHPGIRQGGCFEIRPAGENGGH